jgi:NodT family efflux transporter outer membrane factor (OMF) lipoprotein
MRPLAARLSAALSAGAMAGVLAGALAGALTGCVSGPEYTAPTLAAPAHYLHAAHQAAAAAAQDAQQAQQPARAPAAPIALDRWWLGFGDPALTRLVELALAQNLDLQAADARVEQARASARSAGAALRPKLDLQTSIAAERQSLQSPLGAIGSQFPGYDRNPVLRDEGLAASWELDLAGGLKRGVEQRDAEVDVAQAQRLGVRVSLAAEVADAYLRIRGDRLRLAIAQDQLDADRRLLDLVVARRADGMGTAGEQAQAEARVAQLKASLAPLRADADAESNRLDVLLGATPGTYAAQLAAAPQPLALPVLGSALSPADLLRRRPDVLAAERRLAASSAAIGVAGAAYYPSLSLSALLGMESLHSARPSSANFQPEIVAGLRWRLFDFGAIDAEVARAQAAKGEALLGYRQAMLRATEDVENALVASAYLGEERAALLEQVDAAGRARAQAHDAYLGGAASLTDELELDREYLNARDRLSQVETDAARALVASFRALGGGW